jgi:cinnamyl-alcohol dehydrogenase
VGQICVEDAYQFATGCSSTIVVCGVYSPMKHYQMDVAGKHFGVVDLGGLGHMAIKFGKAFGRTVTVFSTSPSKEKEALEVLRAGRFIVSKDPEQMKVIFFLKT